MAANCSAMFGTSFNQDLDQITAILHFLERAENADFEHQRIPG
jgi:hypothetical protein